MAFDPPPARIVLADVDPARIELAEGVRRRLPSSSRVELRLAAGPEDNYRLIASVPPGSLVINATGMGKDLPGSPVTRAVQFPQDGIVWDLNYRGDLAFLDAARRARAARRLRVFDGWRYFVHGWTQVSAEVLGVPIDRERLDLLARLAEPHGGASSEQAGQDRWAQMQSLDRTRARTVGLGAGSISIGSQGRLIVISVPSHSLR
jgi:shikimate dehydrogenase